MSSQTPTTERDLVEWLRNCPETRGLLGDDCAFLPPLGEVAITLDRQAADIHLPGDTDPEVFARRLLQVNLSDLAASGARGVWAFLGASGPSDYPWKRFFTAFLEAAQRHSVTLAGGDLSRSSAFSATLTLIGSPMVSGRWLRRSGLGPGDRLWVGGALGSSALGCALASRGGRVDLGGRIALPEDLAPEVSAVAETCLRDHFCPRAQIDLAEWLAVHARSATDLSDGLSRDLRHLTEDSGVGATIQESSIALEPEFAALAQRLGLDPAELPLHGGEDYKLLFGLPNGAAPPSQFGCRRIGTATDESGILLVESDGQLKPLPDGGWDQLK